MLVESPTAPTNVGGAVSGLSKTLVSPKEAEYTQKGTGAREIMYMQFAPEYQLILKEVKGDSLGLDHFYGCTIKSLLLRHEGVRLIFEARYLVFAYRIFISIG